MTTQALLEEIKRLGRGRVSDDVLEEVREHLEESIQSRLELGSSLDDAEIAAVAAFGDPKDFVQYLIGDPRQDRIIDPGVGLSLLLAFIASVLMSRIPTYASLFAVLVPAAALIGVLCWTSWKAKILQWPLFLIAFIIGIPVYAYLYGPATSNDLRFDLGTGADSSVCLFGFLGLFSFMSWLIGSLARRDLQREIRAASKSGPRQFRWWHLIALTLFAAFAIMYATSQTVSPYTLEIRPYAFVVLTAPLLCAICLGFRSGLYSLRKYAAALIGSLIVTEIALSFAFVTAPEGNLMSRSELNRMIAIEEPSSWMQGRRQSVEGAVEAQRMALAKAGPPYRLRTSNSGSDGPITRTVNTWKEANLLLQQYRSVQLARVQHDFPFIQRIRGFDMEMRDTPLLLNLLRIFYKALPFWISIWIIFIAAQGMAAFMRIMLARIKPRTTGFA